MQGGVIISKLINLFFITLIINFFITIYTIYTILEFKIFHNKQGSKLKIKKDYIQTKGGDNN